MAKPVLPSETHCEEIEWAAPIEHVKADNRGVIEAAQLPKDEVTLYAGDEYCELDIWRDEVSAQDVKRLRARKFVDLILGGKSPTKAARELNSRLEDMQSKEEVQAEIKRTVEKYWMPADARKMYARAKLMEILTTMDARDTDQAKVMLQALRQVGDDVEVGMYGVKGAPPAAMQIPAALAAMLQIEAPAAKEDDSDTEE